MSNLQKRLDAVEKRLIERRRHLTETGEADFIEPADKSTGEFLKATIHNAQVTVTDKTYLSLKERRNELISSMAAQGRQKSYEEQRESAAIYSDSTPYG